MILRGMTTAFFAATLVAAMAVAPWAMAQDASEWSTPFSEKLGVTLIEQFDSSGPDAWDPQAHPNVFVTTEGPGYGGLLSGVKTPGVVIIDSDTREVVANQDYDVFALGWKDVFEPHGLGVSGDGQWIYLPTGDGRGKGRLLVINARTLKLDKVLATMGRPHHAKTFTNTEGKDLTIAYGWGQPLFIMDPADDNRVVGGLDYNEQGMEGYLYFATHGGEEIWASGRFRPGGARYCCIHDNVVIRIDTKSWEMIDYMAVPDSTPVWVSFSADDRFAYVTGGHTSQIFKYDRLAEGLHALKPVAHQRAGVEGPYGNHLGWDDNLIWTIGKGEGSHNRGKVLGLVSAELMDKTPRPVDQFYTGCTRGDHGTLHPDPDANELWITCNSSFEVVVFDLDQKDVVARIPMPRGGSTHSGSFVEYDGWDGAVVSDQNGLHKTALQAKREILGIAGEVQAPSLSEH